MWTENTAFSCFLCAPNCLCIGLGFHIEFSLYGVFLIWRFFFPFEEFSNFSILITWGMGMECIHSEEGSGA